MNTKYLKCNIVFFLFLHFTIFLRGQTLESFPKLWGSQGGYFFEGKNNVMFFIDRYGYPSIYKSVNDGNSWENVNNILLGIWANVETDADGNIYLVTENKFYYSTDNAENWTFVDSNPSNTLEIVYNLPNGSMFGFSNETVSKSLDFGSNWYEVLNSNDIENSKLFFDNRTEKIFICSGTELWVSSDHGESWKLLLKDDFSNDEKPNIISGLNDKIYVMGAGYIWVFDLNGNFIRKTRVYNYSPLINIYSLFQSQNGLLLSGGTTNFYSDNEGESWYELYKPLEANYSNLFLNSKGTLFGIQSNSGSVYNSKDEGKNWNFSSNGLNKSIVLGLHTINDNSLIVETVDGYFLSQNNGNDFELIHIRYTELNSNSGTSHTIGILEDLVFFGDYKFIYAYDLITKSKKIIKSNPDSFSFRGIIVNENTNSIFVYDYNYLYRSLDKGLTWTIIKPNIIVDKHNFEYIVSKGELFISTGNSIYKSVDNGDSWNLVTSLGNLKSALFKNSVYLYRVGGDDKNGYFIYKSFDNGLNWVKNKINLPVNSLGFDYNIVSNNEGDLFLFIDIESKIYRSINFGKDFKLFSQSYSIAPLIIGEDQRLYIRSYPSLNRFKEPISERSVYKGLLYNDENNDCLFNIQELSDKGGNLVSIKNQDFETYSYSNYLGEFYFSTPPGDFKIQADDISKYQNSCIVNLNTNNLNSSDVIKVGLQEIKKCPEMHVDISLGRLRRCFNSNVYLKYQNKGTDIAFNSYIELKLDDNLIYKKASIIPSTINGQIITFNLGNVPIKSSDFIDVEVEISCNAKIGQTHCVEATIYPNMDCIISLPAKVKTTAICRGDSISCQIVNTSTTAMTSTKNWKLIEYDNAGSKVINYGEFQLNGSETIQLNFLNSSKELMFVAEQVDGNEVDKISQTQIKNCNQALGTIISLDEEEPFYTIECAANVGSFDPNDIIGLPSGITNDKYIDKEQELEYTIRFQNTGTDTAFNINIMDNLENTGLDLSTIEYGASSHPYTYTIIQGNTLLFSFKNIMLPDSNINSLLSNGFLKYKIKPKKDIAANSKITNTAEIYFDFNEAVPTNKELHTIGLPIATNTTSSNVSKKNYIVLTPNPVNNILRISLTKNYINHKEARIKIIDTHGRVMWSGGLNGSDIDVDCGFLNQGVYCVGVIGLDGRIYSKEFLKY